MTPRPSHSLPPEYFDAKYAEKLDYWGFETSAYEAAKYDATIAALPRAHYARGFEIGCSVGVFTARLAERCAELLAVDVAESALDAARRRCPGVRCARMRFPREVPAEEERFDLVVVSEVGYYWSRDELRRAQEEIERRMLDGGHLVLVHWTPEATDYPLTGDEVHESFRARAGWEWLRSERAERYRLDVAERRAV